ncbi:segregation/condensation protein A [soil metagenome]
MQSENDDVSSTNDPDQFRDELSDAEQNALPKEREYWTKLSEFEGPLDILLHFVKAEELDIYNIPIHKITKDFLDYVNFKAFLDIELAGEFLLMASELMKIKAKMLIPVSNEEGEIDEEDPRMVLVRKLIEYKRFKDAAEELSLLEKEAKKQYERSCFEFDNKIIETKDEGFESLKNVTIFNLIKAYKIVLTSIKPQVIHSIETLDITAESQRQFVLDIIDKNGELDFFKMINDIKDRMTIICTFLALLQLAAEYLIELTVDPLDLTRFILKKRISMAEFI